MTELTKAALEGRWPDAIAIHEKYYPLFSGFLKLDTNPVPIKAAMHLAGACEPDLRLPMIPLTDDKTAQLKATLQELNLI
jgi:4-hydroxy-tetrahydrodipicolinate synthase